MIPYTAIPNVSTPCVPPAVAVGGGCVIAMPDGASLAAPVPTLNAWALFVTVTLLILVAWRRLR